MKFWKVLRWTGAVVFVAIVLGVWLMADSRPGGPFTPLSEPRKAPPIP